MQKRILRMIHTVRFLSSNAPRGKNVATKAKTKESVVPLTCSREESADAAKHTISPDTASLWGEKSSHASHRKTNALADLDKTCI